MGRKVYTSGRTAGDRVPERAPKKGPDVGLSDSDATVAILAPWHLTAEDRAAARRYLTRRGYADLVDVLGLTEGDPS